MVDDDEYGGDAAESDCEGVEIAVGNHCDSGIVCLRRDWSGDAPVPSWKGE
jgi:hypothetical protein